MEHRLTAAWRWRLTRVMTGQLIDLRRRLLRRLVADARDLLGLREASKLVLRLGGESRRTTIESASRLSGRLEFADMEDIELLSDGEVAAGLSGASLEIDLDRRRRARWACEAAGPLPRTFAGTPWRPNESAPPGSRLRGWAASPGRHRGAARVVVTLADADLAAGEVLVAHATDPSWTPLFLTAGAIVVEQGGPLSHAAIVARELGVPAVLNVAGAVQRLAHEPEVTVDGEAGTVDIHGEAGSEADIESEASSA